jgi:hypothetical protein
MSYGGMNDADLWFKRCQDLEARVKELEAARAPLLEENERLRKDAERCKHWDCFGESCRAALEPRK